MNDRFLQFMGLIKRSGNLVEGYNSCEETIKKGKLHLLIISNDCSENTREKFIRYCTQDSISYIQGYSKEDLGLILGRPEINIIGVKDKSMSDKLLELWKEKNTD